jgi:glycosyltransferase involved in cell wall biosynthesis
MATKEQAQYLPTSLGGLLAQMYPYIEIIIVSVKGDEETHNALKQYPKGLFTWIEAPPKNYVAHRNLGIDQAKGEYIGLADSDDFWLPNKVQQEISVAQARDALLVYSPFFYGDENLNPSSIALIPPPNYEQLLINCYISDQCLVSRKVYEEFGLFNEDLEEMAMYDKWLRVMEKYPGQVALNPYPTFIYRQSPQQMSKATIQKPSYAENRYKVVSQSLERVGRPIPDPTPLLQDLIEYTGKDRLELQVLLENAAELCKAEWMRMNPKTPEEIVEYYEKGKYILYDLVDWQTRHIYNWWVGVHVNRLIKHVQQGDKVLDFGAGVGTLSILLAQKGCDVTAVDIGGEYLKFAEWRAAKHDIPIKFIRTKGEVPSELKEYNKIIAIEVFGHLPNPVDYAKKLVSHLKSGGLLLYTLDVGGQADYPMHLHSQNLFDGCPFEEHLRRLGLEPVEFGVWKKP